MTSSTASAPFRAPAARTLSDQIALLPEAPVHSIPISASGWSRLVERWDPVRLSTDADAVDVAVASGRDYKTVRAAADLAAEFLRRVGDLAWVTSCFSTNSAVVTTDVLSELRSHAARWERRLLVGVDDRNGETVPAESPGAGEAFRTLAQRVLDAAPPSQDPWMVAFGVARADLAPSRDRFLPSRLLAAFRGRWDEFQHRSNQLCAALGAVVLDLSDMPSAAQKLIESDDPFAVVVAAARVRAAIAARHRDDPAAVEALISKTVSAADTRDANVRVARHMQASIRDALTADEAALLRLGLYAHVVEGQLRPWAEAWLQLVTATAEVPEKLAHLHDRTATFPDPLSREMAAAIHSDVRNAGAHSGTRWLRTERVLDVGGKHVSLEWLDRVTDHCDALRSGCELGLLLARADIADLAAKPVGHRPSGPIFATPESAARENALSFFGANGISIRQWSLDADGFAVEVEPFTYDLFLQCAQGAFWASRHLGDVERFQVLMRDQPVFDLAREPLDATTELWSTARIWFPEMPTSAWVPLLISNAARDWTAAHQIDTALWLALDDAVRAYDDFRGDLRPLPVRLDGLSRRLLLAAESLRNAAELHPRLKLALQGREHRALRDASKWAAAPQSTQMRHRSNSLANLIRSMYRQRPRSVPLPQVFPDE